MRIVLEDAQTFKVKQKLSELYSNSKSSVKWQKRWIQLGKPFSY